VIRDLRKPPSPGVHNLQYTVTKIRQNL